MNRLGNSLAAVAAALGAGGVVLAAAAAHRGGGDLGRTASDFLIMHAAALLGVAALTRAAPPRPARRLALAGASLALGVTLFCADLAARVFLSTRLFPFAAPLGGSLTILAWIALVVVFLSPE